MEPIYIASNLGNSDGLNLAWWNTELIETKKQKVKSFSHFFIALLEKRIISSIDIQGWTVAVGKEVWNYLATFDLKVNEARILLHGNSLMNEMENIS